eukprot:TRINITY_DN0_c105_g1_i2.p1 TRINITY_DN0_c105_g1~~TRINITY_DN0_c105_g1_i2.p1  ORF type:complete len:392 (+),score=69.49 TRINITY_DN0_c105_g1_i2:1-1176(+)
MCIRDRNKVQEKKASIVSGLTRGVEGLFKKNGVDYYKGLGAFKDKNTIGIKLNDGKDEEVTGKNIIIATGSDAAQLKELPFDGKVVVSSTEVLSLPKVPKKMIVIGAGIIGLELGSVYNRLGSEVTVLALTDIIPGSDSDMVKELSTALKQQGMKILTNTKMETHKMVDGGIEITTSQKKGKKGPTLKAEHVMVAIGRVPYTKDLNLEAVGIKKDQSGRVEINDKFQTAVPHVFAIGDVVRGAMLAHKAEEEGVAVVEIIKNGEGHVNYNCIPSVLYTHPEVAFVGKTEEELKKQKIQYGKGSFPMAANARAKCNDDFRGLVKVLTDKKTDKILGVHMIGSDAGEMIHEAALAMEYGASSEDVSRTCHAHPTLSEAMKEACMAAHSKAIHI